MNTPHHLDYDQLTLLYFDHGPPAALDHLNACAACRDSYSEITLLLNAARAIPVPEKDTDWEQRLWNTIAPSVRLALPRPRPMRFSPWLLAPAFAALLAMAFLVGRSTRPAPAAAFSPQARERVLLITLGDHLDRSQIVLAELVNAPEGVSLNIAAQQQLAGSLVSENRLLRQVVSRQGDLSDAAVLDDLERVLLDVAHSPAEVSPGELDRLRQRIASQELLFKVRVITTNVREKGMKL